MTESAEQKVSAFEEWAWEPPDRTRGPLGRMTPVDAARAAWNRRTDQEGE